MSEKQIIAGLDVGTTKIRLVVGTPDTQGLRILGSSEVESEGVVEGNITNIGKVAAGIKKIVQEVSEAIQEPIRAVNTSITGRHVKSSIHRGSITRDTNEEEISPKDTTRITEDMYRIVVNPTSKVIHVIPQIYFIDGQEGITDPVGIPGIRLEGNFQVITAQSSAIDNIEKTLKRAGLVIDKLIVSSLASSMAVLTPEEQEAGVCLVDIGGGTVDIAIFHDNILRYTTSIPFAGNAVTEDIQQGCMIMRPQAETLKQKFGKAIEEGKQDANTLIAIPGLRNRPDKEIYLPVLSRIIEARMEEIIQTVHSEIIASGFHNKLAGGMVITGEGVRLQLIENLFTYITSYDTRIGYPIEPLIEKEENLTQIGYASAIGLVVAGYKALDCREEKYRNQYNFVPQETKKLSSIQRFFITAKRLILGGGEEEKK